MDIIRGHDVSDCVGPHIQAHAAAQINWWARVGDAGNLRAVHKCADACPLKGEFDSVKVGADGGELRLGHRRPTGPGAEFDEAEELRTAGGVLRVNPGGIMPARYRVQPPAKAAAERANGKAKTRLDGIV